MIQTKPSSLSADTPKWWRQTWFKILLFVPVIGLIALLASMQMAGQSCIFESQRIHYYHFIPINLIYFLCWGILFFPIRKVCHLILAHVRNRPLIFGLNILMAMFFSLIHLRMFQALLYQGIRFSIITPMENYNYSILTNIWPLTYRWLGSNIYIYIAIAGFLHFFYFYHRHQEKELKTSQLETEMVQTQLQSLKMQLQPHFLFNSLNTISAYVKKSPDTAIKMTARLSDLLRLTLETRTHQEIPLKEELDIVDNYLEIEKLRFSDRLKVKLDIAPDTVDIPVPAMLLQPLVENAIRHGISRKIDEGVITISARKKVEKGQNQLLLTVADDGPGLQEENTQKSLNHGIGLKNTIERVRKLYDGHADVTILSETGQGFKVTVTIPAPPRREPAA